MTSQEFSTNLAYTVDQLYLYLKRINFFKDGEQQDQKIPVNYETLAKIIRCHVLSIPYGNSSYIYYKRLLKPEGNYPTDIRDPYTTQGASTDLQDIFKKIVLDERDGVCIENNPLCAHMLMTLGFNTYLVTSNCVEPIAWDQRGEIELRSNLHCAIIVELDGKEYFLDVGAIMGRTPKPILLEDGLITEISPLVEYRISRSPFPDRVIQLTNPKHTPWLLESKTKQLPNKPITKRNDWSPLTYIYMCPTYIKDMQVMNDMGVRLRLAKLLRRVIVMNIETEEGYITLRNNTMKIYTLNGIETIQLKSEKERRKAYLKYFNTKVPKDHLEHLPSDASNYIYYLTTNIDFSMLKGWIYWPLYYISNKLSF
ncbi:cysteine proteinase [Conidiobolus coronatus NRRL 28638]|uniref:Cysteine proteinase n=1 Tax=Conidiobolus coronatus (strain ATCC 28846 / CBS 209.66 / NRRL 28638) TaxID=796925 RepID=A0A137P2E7_CONC2|nr:cysteine proteinase [Conidiobolus coronatus NRRL 28638]|eukprot:KXN69215.1 cysteine proteinase [Conidiobolus coronatus NRRL 28638]